MIPLSGMLRRAEKRLAAVTETPRLDAELLLAHALGITRAAVLARLRESPDAPDFEALLARRLNHEPIAYITGEWEFFSLPVAVRPPVLVPRPETEHLVETALEAARAFPAPARMLDIGTGTGCVAVAIAVNLPGAEVHAADINPEALVLTRENADRHNVSIHLHEGDLFAALPEDMPPFEIIVSNPPYVEDSAWEDLSPVIRKHEDRRALLAGPEGLDIIRRLIAEAPAFLASGGLLALETGENQAESVLSLLEKHGFRDCFTVKDLAGIPRISAGRWQS
jgi:release factor glutamine methyltransferase